jgi:hypothetical protein
MVPSFCAPFPASARTRMSHSFTGSAEVVSSNVSLKFMPSTGTRATAARPGP